MGVCLWLKVETRERKVVALAYRSKVSLETDLDSLEHDFRLHSALPKISTTSLTYKKNSQFENYCSLLFCN